MASKDNLLKFIELTGIKKSDFYRKTGLSNGFLDKNANISSDKIEIIISNYPEINLYWLVTGEGEMLRNTTISPVESSVIYKSDPKDIAALADKQVIINDKNKIIAMQDEKIRGLEAQLSVRPTGLHTAHSVGTTQEVEKPHHK